MSKMKFKATLVLGCIHGYVNIMNNQSSAIVAMSWGQCTHRVYICLVDQPMWYFSCAIVGARKEHITATDRFSILWLVQKDHIYSCKKKKKKASAPVCCKLCLCPTYSKDVRY